MSSVDHTVCASNCQFEVDHAMYDLSGLQGEQPAIPYDNMYLSLDICNPLPSSDYCLDSNYKPSKGFVCLGGKNVGRILSVVPKGRTDDMKRLIYDNGANVILEYTGGAQIDGCDNNNQSLTRISFFCDNTSAAAIPPQQGQDVMRAAVSETASMGSPEQDTEDHHHTRNDKCLISLRWKSYNACPVCTITDYQLHEAPCVNGTHHSFRIRINPCFGPNIIEAGNKNCENNMMIPFESVLGVVSIILLLVVVLGILYYRNKTLQHRYSLLSEEKNKQVEMVDLENAGESKKKKKKQARQEGEPVVEDDLDYDEDENKDKEKDNNTTDKNTKDK